MRKWLILLSALSVTSVSGAPAWTWIDASGQVHYSDTPVPGAKQVELTGAQGFGTARQEQSAIASPAQPGASAPTSGTQAPAATSYRTFTIVSPGQQETLRNIGTMLSVQVALDPRLQSNHRLDLSIDGERRNLNSMSLALSVPEVFRGSHTVQAVIVDQRGTEILRSPVTTFIVQQTSLLNPNAPLARARQNGGN